MAARRALEWIGASEAQLVFRYEIPDVFSSKCMLELKFAIYYRVASLPSQASYALLAEESSTRPGLIQTLPVHTNCISNSAILHDNYISLLSDLCACVHVKKNGVVTEAIVIQ